jgi:hypothetical protein
MSAASDNVGDRPQAATAATSRPELPGPPAHAGAGTVNADNPWPGLLAFREADHEYFEGRRTETEELFRLVMRERLTVFFGLSGLGKSSLLQAGLFPLLRRESILPVYIRLDFSSANPDLIAQVQSAIARQAELADIEAPAIDPTETLWEYFHRHESGFWTRRNRPVMPLIAFDQVEELFTLGRLDAQRMRATETLLDQLADLAEGRPPAALKEWLDDHPDNARHFTFTRHHYKVLLSTREDFLPDLEGLRQRMPSVALNRLRLQRMNGGAALRVVAQAKHLIDVQVAEKVVRFVAAGRSGVPLESLEVEPALLSVVCRELNNKRQNLHEPKITERLLEGSHDQVLNDFYERTVGDLPVEVRRFIEERLLTVSGFRDSVALENALNLPGITGAGINQLVERRLLRREDRGGVQRVELTHDLLTGVVRASRDRRHQQEEAEKARAALLEEQERERQLLKEQREEEEKERAKRELRRTRRVAAIFALLTLIAIAGLIGAIYSRSEMQKANTKEQEARREAVQQATYADDQRKIAEEAVNRIQQSLLIRQAALSGAQEQLNDLLSKLGQNDSIQFGAVASNLHYKSGGYDIYKFELFPRRDTLPSGRDAVAFITYLADHPTFQNTLLTAGQKREFRAAYTGWGCLHRIVALTEYSDPTKSPTVTVFNMCKLLGGRWYQDQ